MSVNVRDISSSKNFSMDFNALIEDLENSQKNITNVILRKRELNDTQAVALAEALKKNKKLQKLDLGNCVLSLKGLEVISEAIVVAISGDKEKPTQHRPEPNDLELVVTEG